MKRAALPLAVAGFACAALLSCPTGVGGHISEPDKDKIRKVVEQASRAIAPPTSDVNAYVKLYYVDDARVLPRTTRRSRVGRRSLPSSAQRGPSRSSV